MTVSALSINGDILWQNTEASEITTLAVDNTNGRTYAGSRNNDVYAINNSNGKTIWTTQLDASISSIKLSDIDYDHVPEVIVGSL